MATTPKSTVKISKFEKQAIEGLNKSEKDLKLEKVKDFVIDAIIETKSSISSLETSDLAKANHELEKANRELTKAESNYEKVKFEISLDFSTYFQNRKTALKKVEEAKSKIASIQANIATIELNISYFKEILADLEA